MCCDNQYQDRHDHCMYRLTSIGTILLGSDTVWENSAKQRHSVALPHGRNYTKICIGG